MRTIETTVYKFDELTEEAKEKAVQRLSDINVDYRWYESTFDDAEGIGLKITDFEADRYAKGKFINSAHEVAEAIIRDHGVHCETAITANNYMAEYKELEKNTPEEDDLETDAIDEEFLKSLLEDYRILLRKEYEYLTSEEAIIETIQANEYEFTSDGKLA